MIALAIWFFACFLFSAFFSASVMAFVSSNKVQMRKLADGGDRSAKAIIKFYKKTPYFLASILIGNNIANITATTILTYVLSEKFRVQSETLITLIMTPLLLIFAEVIPKDYARLHNQFFLRRFSGLLQGVLSVLHIFTSMTLKCVDFFLAPLGGGNRKSIFVSEKEFRSIVEEGTRSGVLSQPEKRIIDTILDFEKVKVQAVMTPVEKAPRVELHYTVHDAKRVARETGAKMLLVYEEIPSIVMGMVYVFDLLFEDDETQGLKSFLRSPVFIPKTASNERAFFTLQRRHQSYAVIVDDEQDVVGVVAIERLLAF